MAKDSTNSIGECCKIRPKNVAKIWPGKWCNIRPGKSCKFGRENGAKFGQEKIVVKESKRNRYLLWILRAVCKLGTNWLENCMNNDGEIFSIKFKPECCQNINAKPRPFKGCLDVDRKLQPFLGMPQQNVDREASIFSREAGRSESFCVDRETLLHWQKLDHVVHFVVLTSIGTTWMLRPGFHCMQPEIHCIDTNLHRKRSMAFFT